MKPSASDAPPPANVRTWAYKEKLEALPARIQEAADAAFQAFLQNPAHPALAVHALTDSKKGRHRKGSKAVSVTRRYRAIYVVDGPTNVWYWVGSHEDYNNFIGK